MTSLLLALLAQTTGFKMDVKLPTLKWHEAAFQVWLGQIVVPVRVGGCKTWVNLDTGAVETYWAKAALSSSLFPRDPNQDVTVNLQGNCQIEARGRNPFPLTSRLLEEDRTVRTRPIGGLGVAALRQVVFGLDFETREFRSWLVKDRKTGLTWLQQAQDRTTSPIAIRFKPDPDDPRPFATVTINSLPLDDVLVDLGSIFVSVQSTVVRNIPSKWGNFPGGNLVEAYPEELKIVPEVGWEDCHFKSGFVLSDTKSEMSVLGWDYLSGARVLFDLSAGKVDIVMRLPQSTPLERVLIRHGIRVDSQGVVTQVAGQAQAAGLHVGDRLTSLWGVPFSKVFRDSKANEIATLKLEIDWVIGLHGRYFSKSKKKILALSLEA